jgi:hypothetical protein
MGADVFYEKLQLFRDVMQFKKTKTVPLLCNASGWVINDTTYPPAEAYYDPEKMWADIVEFGQRYEFDGYQTNGFVYMFPVFDALGGDAGYQLDTETGAISTVDFNLIYPEEYPIYAADPNGFMRTAFARKHPDLSTEDFLNALMLFMQWGQYAGKASEELFKNTLHRPITNSMTTIVQAPLEILMNASLRGIKDISIDLRRYRANIEELLESCWQQTQLPGFQYNVAQGNPDFICDIYTSLLAHTILNREQFENLYWPYFKQIIDTVAANGRRVHIYCEGEMLRFYEFFQEIPRGVAIFHIEQDDICEVRRRCPNLCLAGGFPTEFLYNASIEQCIDAAKQLIDDMGEGFIFSTTKLLAYREDARRENLLAVNEFVRNYQVS